MLDLFFVSIKTTIFAYSDVYTSSSLLEVNSYIYVYSECNFNPLLQLKFY